jgi:hypothetical protein
MNLAVPANLATQAPAPYILNMGGPSTKPAAPRDPPTFVPHPDDADAVREGAEQAERGDLLSAEESEEYLRKLLAEERQSK